MTRPSLPTAVQRPGSTAPAPAAARRVFFVCQVFHPDPQSTSQLFTPLLQTIRRRHPSLEIQVICGFPSAARYPDLAGVPARQTLDGIRIRRCGLRLDPKRGFVARAAAYASFLLHTMLTLLTVRRNDLVFGVTNPPFLGIVLWLASLLRRFDYQYMFHDVHPEGLFRLGMLRQSSIAARLWVSLNRLAYRRATLLPVLGRDMIPLLARDYGLPVDRFRFIPHWSAVEAPEPIPLEQNPVRADVGPADAFIVQYSGNMGLWHDMDTFVRAATALRDEPRIRFLFIGGGIRRDERRKLAAEIGADNIVWKDFVPQDQLELSLACCHVSLVSLKAGLEGVAVPCKIYGILASGRPILALAPVDSEVGLLVHEENCGMVIRPGDVDGLVDAIRTLAADPDRVRTLSGNSFTAYRRKYTLLQGVEAFESIWGLRDPV